MVAMADAEMTGLEIAAGLASGLPAPVKTSFLKAMSNLLGGLTAIPAAKLKQYAQGIEDTTAARSVIATSLANAALNDARSDPLLLQAATELYLPTDLRKAVNRLKVAQKAAIHIGEPTAEPDQSDAPEEDWMNAFARFAEDASSEKLQEQFARILADQVKRPGSFSLATLRVISELDQTIANDFSIAWSKSVGGAVDKGPEFDRGEEFARWKRLAEAGLMAPSSTAQYLPPFKPLMDGLAVWTPFSVEATYLLVYYQENCSANWGHIDFTRVGRQIGSILPRPDYEANMRAAGQRLPVPGVMRVDMHTPNGIKNLFFAHA
jgi:hypothetical protein